MVCPAAMNGDVFAWSGMDMADAHGVSPIPFVSGVLSGLGLAECLQELLHFQ